MLSTVDMVVQRRDGPRRLRDNDDDVCLCVFRTDVCDRVTVSQMDRYTFARHVDYLAGFENHKRTQQQLMN